LAAEALEGAPGIQAAEEDEEKGNDVFRRSPSYAAPGKEKERRRE